MMMFVVFSLSFFTRSVLSSWGDQTSYHQMCLEHCYRDTCGSSEKHAAWDTSQPLANKLVGVTCPDDCKYTCMWMTVEEMEKRHGFATGIPQFYGKWPFTRMLGMQEPASVLFSIMNLLTNLYMIIWFRNIVPGSAPMINVWTFYSFTAVNAWIWSTIFHTRDTANTEMLDYFSAFLTVLTSLMVCVIRFLGPEDNKVGVVIAGFVAFYAHHVYNMAFVRFDYGYNMKVNVAIGILNGVLWLSWSYFHYNDGKHVRKGMFAILMLSLSLSLELLDFAPIYWILDSHALWHLATVPIPLLWLRFAAGDCLLLDKEQRLRKKTNKKSS